MTRMMKALCIAVCALAAGCSSASADGSETTEDAGYTSSSSYGTITNITSDAITIEGTDIGTLVIPITSSTPIIKDGVTISSDELCDNDYVMITLTNGIPTVVDVLDEDDLTEEEDKDSSSFLDSEKSVSNGFNP